MTTTTPTMIETTCRYCGQVTAYEHSPFLQDGGISLLRICDDCEAAREKREEADKLKAELIEREIRVKAILPPDLLETSVSHPDYNRTLHRAVIRWRPTPDKRWLGLIGPAGRCKTRCMAQLAAAVIRSGRRVCWVSACRLADDAADRTSWDRQVSAASRERLDAALSAAWLFLDDLGKNHWSAAFESQLFQILDHRLNHHLPLVYTSNIHPSGFSSVISAVNASPIIGRLTTPTDIIDLD